MLFQNQPQKLAFQKLAWSTSIPWVSLRVLLVGIQRYLQCFPEKQTRLDLVDQDVSYYKSVRFSLFFLGIEAQKRVLRPFELLVNISAIITENWGLCYKKHKRGWRRIPSKKIVSFLVFLLKETRKPPSFFQSFDEIQAIIRGSNGPSLYGIYMKFEKKLGP